MANEYQSLIEFLALYIGAEWDAWPRDMNVTILGPNNFSFSGTCPHCRAKAVFMIVAGPYIEAYLSGQVHKHRLCAAMQCQGCQKFILGIINRYASGAGEWLYETHYPLGRPHEIAPDGIPADIASDFKEAQRCRWIEAYNATGEMCRRALEGSCNEKKAPAGKLVDKIDWLATQGIITVALKDVAHKIRLGGNYGAHAPEDPLLAAPMTAEHADALIEFMRDYFQHVYVMPAKLAKYDFTKQGMNKPTP